MKINFFAGEKIFSCGRKSYGIREEIIYIIYQACKLILPPKTLILILKKRGSVRQARKALPPSFRKGWGVSFTCEPTRGPP